MPGFTSTAPVEGLNISWAGTVKPDASVNAEFAVVAARPLMRSPLKAFVTAVAPDAPLMPVTVSFVATTGPATMLTVMVAVLQLVGFSFSHIL